MRVRLVQVSAPAPAYLRELETEQDLEPNSLDGLGPEALLVHIARVSSSRDNTFEEPHKLIGYMMDHRHWSPFEQTYVTMEVQTSRAIGRQLLRHRSFTFQEFSQRYAAVTAFEPIELRQQAVTNRQSSTDVFDPTLSDVFQDSNEDPHDLLASLAIQRYLESGQRLYQEMLEEGVAKETARFILPEATQTTIYMTASLRSWMHYFEERDNPNAQKEAQEIARAQAALFRAEFPNVWLAFRKHRAEKVLKDMLFRSFMARSKEDQEKFLADNLPLEDLVQLIGDLALKF